MSTQIQNNQTIQDEINFINVTNRIQQDDLASSSLSKLQAALEDTMQMIGENVSGDSNVSLTMISELIQALLGKSKEQIIDELESLQTEADEVATEEAPSEASSTSSVPGGMDAVFEMEGMIVELLESFIQSNSSQSQQQVEMGNATLAALQDQYDKIEKEIKKENKYKHMSFWDKLKSGFKLVFDTIKLISPISIVDPSSAKNTLKSIENNPELGDVLQALSYVAMAATVIIAGATGNFELLALTVVLFALTQSGAMNSMTKEVAKGLEDMGVSSSLANVLADVIVVVVLAALSGGAGGFSLAADDAAATTADLAGEEGTEMVEMSSETIGDAAANDAEEGASETEQKLSFSLKRALGISLNVGGQTLASTNFAIDLVNALPIPNKDKEKWMIAVEILVTVACMTATLGGGGLAASAEGESALSSSIESTLGKASSYVSEQLPETMQKFSMDADLVLALGRTTLSVSNALSGFYSIMQGMNTIDQGKIREKIAKWEGNINLLSSDLKQNQDMLKNTQKQEQTMLQSFDSMMSNFSDFADPQQAVADAMLQG